MEATATLGASRAACQMMPAVNCLPTRDLAPRLSGLRTPWWGYICAVTTSAAAFAVHQALDAQAEQQAMLMLFTVPIVLSAYVGGFRGGLLATALTYYVLPFFYQGLSVASPAEHWQLSGALAGVLISVTIEGLQRERHRANVAAREHHQADERAAQNERHLRESNERFNQLADNIADAFWIRSPDLRTLHYISPAFERIWGRSVASLYANPQQWSEYIFSEDRERVLSAFDSLKREVPSVDIQYRIVRPDTEIRWVSVRAYQVRDAAGTLIRLTGIVSDITERRRVESALLESEGRYRALVDWSPESVTVTRFGKILFINPAAVKMMAAASDRELIGRHILDFVHPDFRDVAVDRLKHNADVGGSLPPLEEKLLKVDGTVMDVEIQGAWIMYDGEPATFSSLRDVTETKRAAEALRASMEEFRTLAEAVPQIVWIARPDGWNVYFNQHWMDYTGLSADESRGHGWITPFHPDDQQRAQDAWLHATTTMNTYSVECRLRRADGVYRWWLVRGVPMQDAAGKILKWFGTYTDIHDLKMAELEISRVNRALKMLSSCNEALIREDHETALLQKICAIAVEHGGYRMAWVGYAQDDQAQSIMPRACAGVEDGYLSAIKVTWREDAASGQGPAGQAIRTGQAVVCEDVTLAPEFQPWFELAQTCGYRGVTCLPLRDATRAFGLLTLYSAEIKPTSAAELKLLQDLADDVAFGISNLRLHAEQERLDIQVREQAALLDIATDAIYARNLAGQITFWNKGAERAYGHAASDALGRHALELLGGDFTRFAAAEADLLTHGVWEGEMSRRTKSDGVITMAVRWTLVRDADGKPKSILAIDTDVTEKKALESQFLRAQRMEGIGTLAGGLAHDLNNMLAPIVMSIEMLKALVKDSEGISLLSTLQGSAHRGAMLVKQVLSFARGIEGQRIVVKPVPVMGDLLEVIRDTFPKSIEVRFTPAHGLWAVTGDPTQMHQVFLNLCVNARDAMPTGGTITITMENVVLTSSSAKFHPEARPGEYVMIAVSDSGTGIAPEILDRVFEPFFTTKETGKGTGLGLSTTLAIVKSHRGFIHLQSALGQGTTFSVYLPANTSLPAAEHAGAKDSRLPLGEQQLILVVDDEEAIRNVARRMLERSGYRVLLACDGAQAITIYAAHQDEIALVLTDMSMPVMDGAALIARLESMNPLVRIVRSSGLLSAVEATNVGTGAQHFIPKPYTAAAMLRTLHEVLSN